MNQLGQPSSGIFDGDINISGNITAFDGNFNNINVLGTTTTGVLKINPNSLNSITFPTSRGTVNQILQLNGSGILNWATLSGSNSSSDIIYKPLGVTAGNIYATWPEIVTVSNSLNGLVNIYVDSSLQSPAPFTSNLNGFGTVTIKPYNQTEGSGYVMCSFSADVQFTNIRAFDGAFNIEANSQALPNFVFSDSSIIEVLNGAVFSVGPSCTIAPLQILTDTGLVVACGLGSGINNSSNPSVAFVNVASGGTFILANILNTNPSAWSNNIVTSVDNTATLVEVKDASGFPLTNSGFTGNVVQSLIDLSSNVSYNDSLLPNIGVTVQLALDYIKQYYYKQHSLPEFQNVIVDGVNSVGDDGNNYIDMKRNDEVFDNFLRFWNTGTNWWSLGMQNSQPDPVNDDLRILNNVTPETVFRVNKTSNITYITRLSLGTDDLTVYNMPLARGTVNQILKTDGSGNVSWDDQSGGGNVTGPGSSTDNAIARYDGTTGTLLQDCLANVDDTGFIESFGLHSNGPVEVDEYLELFDLAVAPASPAVNFSRIYQKYNGIQYNPNPNIWSRSSNAVPISFDTKVYTDYFFTNNALPTTFIAGANWTDVVSVGLLQNNKNNTDYGTWTSIGSQVKYDAANLRSATVRITVNFDYSTASGTQIRRFSIFTGNPLLLGQASIVKGTTTTSFSTGTVQAIATLAPDDIVSMRVENNDLNTTSILISNMNYNIVEI